MEDNMLYIDVEDALKRVINNTKLYAKLLVKFKEDPSFNELGAALTTANMEKAQNSIHALKGLAANLSLHELRKECTELEMQIKAGLVNPDQVAIVNNVYAETLLEADKVIAQYV
jgi:HPt (histidine-containing phosphotransfer) domain-containing protein